MLMIVLGVFKSYQIHDIMDMPYRLFANLFTMAEKLTMLNAEMVMLGRHMSKDPELANSCSVTQKKIKFRKTYKAIANDDAKAKAEQLAKGINNVRSV